MAKRNSKLETRLRKEIKNLRNAEPPHHKAHTIPPEQSPGHSPTPEVLNNHLGQIHQSVDELLDSYHFLFAAIEVIHFHGSLTDQAVYGLAHMVEGLRAQGELVLGRIGEIER